MPAAIRIQHLQWIVGAAAAIGCSALGGVLVLNNVAELRRASRAVDDASQFALVLAATDMISAERGPANVAMDPLGPTSSEALAKLAATRAETDRRLAAAQVSTLRTSVFDAVIHRLAEGRAKVDAVSAKPPEERPGAMIAEAIQAMFAAADEAAALRIEYGRRLLRHAPEVGAEVLLQAEASALREQAGRLGSYAVMTLTGGLPMQAAIVSVTRTQDKITYLWQNLSAFAHNHGDDPSIREALARVETDYFGRSLPMAMEVFAEPSLRGSAAEFTRRYVPGLTASTDLKERLGALTLRKIEKAREAAIAATFASAGVTLAVVLALLWLGLTFRRRLFLPLISVREEILSLSVGGLGNPPSRAKAGPEVDEMFAGLAVLRDELRRKQVLERERRRTNQHLKLLAETDSLTGLLNRRAAAEQAPGVIEAARQAGQPLGAILLDIDHFKTVNDVYGHAGGDAVLKRVAAVLTSLARPGDLVVRYGGEEFLVLAPGLDAAATADLAERMRLRLAAGQGDRASIPDVTGSFGVAAHRTQSDRDWEALVARADAALYRAKRLGRNRVCTDTSKPEGVRRTMRQRA